VKRARASTARPRSARPAASPRSRESLFLDFVNKQHDGFIGHAALGNWVNLGRHDLQHLKNNYGSIRVDYASASGTRVSASSADDGEHPRAPSHSFQHRHRGRLRQQRVRCRLPAEIPAQLTWATRPPALRRASRGGGRPRRDGPPRLPLPARARRALRGVGEVADPGGSAVASCTGRAAPRAGNCKPRRSWPGRAAQALALRVASARSVTFPAS